VSGMCGKAAAARRSCILFRGFFELVQNKPGAVRAALYQGHDGAVSCMHVTGEMAAQVPFVTNPLLQTAIASRATASHMTCKPGGRTPKQLNEDAKSPNARCTPSNCINRPAFGNKSLRLPKGCIVCLQEV
jgi:hypothetical protein